MSSPDSAQLPASIGRYAVVELLGTGAFSAVYRAADERVGGDVAIKLLADHHSLDPDIRERFIAEARLLRRISDRHVVRLYELDETERHQPYLVLEYIDGGNLAQRRAAMQTAGRTVGVDDLTRVAANVDAALTALHVQRIVHRDLSPRNLLVRGNGGDPDGLLGAGDELVLADLGLSKDLAASSGLTAAAGTDGFAAPEQRTAGIVDERADVYAASALLAWLVLGRTGPTTAADLIAAGWPEALGRLLAGGLDPDPERRPPSIAAWRAAIDIALRPPPPAPVRRRPARRRLVVTAAVSAVAAAGITLGALHLADRGTDARDDSVNEAIGDDRIRVSNSVGDVTVAFEGPATLERDTRALFRADVEGAPEWVWTADESGGAVAGAAELAITPRADTLTLNLTAVTTTGEAVIASHTFTVTEPAGDTEPAADAIEPLGT